MLLKILIIVFSRTGTTAKIANIIKEETGGDIFNVTSLIDYSGVGGYLKGCYHQIVGTIPDIKELPNIDGYDLIYVGSPTWAWKPSGPILNVLHNTDFKNKSVIPFLTSGGNYGAYFDRFAAEAKNANIIGEGAFRGAERLNDNQLREKVTSWLKTLNIEQNTENSAEQNTEKQGEL